MCKVLSTKPVLDMLAHLLVFRQIVNSSTANIMFSSAFEMNGKHLLIVSCESAFHFKEQNLWGS